QRLLPLLWLQIFGKSCLHGLQRLGPLRLLPVKASDFQRRPASLGRNQARDLPESERVARSPALGEQPGVLFDERHVVRVEGYRLMIALQRPVEIAQGGPRRTVYPPPAAGFFAALRRGDAAQLRQRLLRLVVVQVSCSQL